MCLQGCRISLRVSDLTLYSAGVWLMSNAIMKHLITLLLCGCTTWNRIFISFTEMSCGKEWPRKTNEARAVRAENKQSHNLFTEGAACWRHQQHDQHAIAWMFIAMPACAATPVCGKEGMTLKVQLHVGWAEGWEGRREMYACTCICSSTALFDTLCCPLPKSAFNLAAASGTARQDWHIIR